MSKSRAPGVITDPIHDTSAAGLATGACVPWCDDHGSTEGEPQVCTSAVTRPAEGIDICAAWYNNEEAPTYWLELPGSGSETLQRLSESDVRQLAAILASGHAIPILEALVGLQDRLTNAPGYDVHTDAAERWPGWTLASAELTTNEMVYPDEKLIEVNPGMWGGDADRGFAHALAHLDLGHLESAVDVFTVEQETQANTLAGFRTGRRKA